MNSKTTCAPWSIWNSSWTPHSRRDGRLPSHGMHSVNRRRSPGSSRVDLELDLDATLAPSRAFAIALDAFGEPKALSEEFNRAGRPPWRRLLLAGWAMYIVSWCLPVFGPGVAGLFGANAWTTPASWLVGGSVGGWIVPLIPNLAMILTVSALWRSWRLRARWLTWVVGTVGVLGLGLGIVSFFQPPTTTINGEFAGYTQLGLGYWAWSAAHVMVAAALRLRNRDWASARPKTRTA
jgi:hypothetical protein